MVSCLGEAFAPRLAHILLETRAVQINTKKLYTWTSGKKFPIYCDNRRLLSYPAQRSEVKEALMSYLRQHFSALQAIAAVATAGIPHGAIVADAMRLPFLYVRSKPKAHGLGRQIEGQLPVGQQVALIEDLISTGGSALSAAHALQAAKCQVMGVVALFSYGLSCAQKAFEEAGLPLHVLCCYDDLLRAALSKGYISNKTHNQLASIFENE